MHSTSSRLQRSEWEVWTHQLGSFTSRFHFQTFQGGGNDVLWPYITLRSELDQTAGDGHTGRRKRRRKG